MTKQTRAQVITTFEAFTASGFTLRVIGIDPEAKMSDAVAAKAQALAQAKLQKFGSPGKASGLSGYGYLIIDPSAETPLLIMGLWLEDGRCTKFYRQMTQGESPGQDFSSLTMPASPHAEILMGREASRWYEKMIRADDRGGYLAQEGLQTF